MQKMSLERWHLAKARCHLVKLIGFARSKFLTGLARYRLVLGLALGMFLFAFAFLITHSPIPPVAQAVEGTLTISGTSQTLTGDVTTARIVDSANSAYFIDPAASGTSLSLAGAASISGSLTLPNGSGLRPAFGPTTLSYKSEYDAWTTGLTIQDGTGNVGIGTTTPSTKLDVVGTITGTTKNFEIAHPTKPGMKLVHSTLEGPEVAVFYRGETQLVNGETVVMLPNYFEALTKKEGRTVQLTTKNGWSPLYVSGEVINGRFTVKADSGNASQQFFWEVKAVRADVEPLVVEKSVN